MEVKDIAGLLNIFLAIWLVFKEIKWGIVCRDLTERIPVILWLLVVIMFHTHAIATETLPEDAVYLNVISASIRSASLVIILFIESERNRKKCAK